MNYVLRTAIAAFIIVGISSLAAANDSQRFLTWLEVFKANASSDLSPTASAETVRLLKDLEEWTSQRGQIASFRGWQSDDSAVIALIPFAASYAEGARKPAATVLANVVDNTNVCYIIEYLSFSPEIDDNGRYNLLQILLQVAPYSYRDTGDWIMDYIIDAESIVLQRDDMLKTKAIMQLIQQRLRERETNSRLSLEVVDKKRYDDCKKALSGESFDKYVPPRPTFGLSPSEITPEKVREIFFTERRREFSKFLVSLHSLSTLADKQLIVAGLQGAIIAPGEDPQRRYRVNIYVALTFSALPEKSAGAAAFAALESMRKSPEYRDITFKKNVDRALRKQAI